VVSHDGDKLESIPVSSSRGILSIVPLGTHVVAIDEAQFFDEGLIGVCDILASSGVRVIVAGLDTNFRAEPFGPMPMLLALAEDVTKLNAICIKCGAPASRTQRLVNGKPAKYDDPVVMIGASESYEARCRRCHEVPGKP
jgi:thymidine kinase